MALLVHRHILICFAVVPALTFMKYKRILMNISATGLKEEAAVISNLKDGKSSWVHVYPIPVDC
jgi:hypothetical protein